MRADDELDEDPLSPGDGQKPAVALLPIRQRIIRAARRLQVHADDVDEVDNLLEVVRKQAIRFQVERQPLAGAQLRQEGAEEARVQQRLAAGEADRVVRDLVQAMDGVQERLHGDRVRLLLEVPVAGSALEAGRRVPEERLGTIAPGAAEIAAKGAHEDLAVTDQLRLALDAAEQLDDAGRAAPRGGEDSPRRHGDAEDVAETTWRATSSEVGRVPGSRWAGPV